MRRRLTWAWATLGSTTVAATALLLGCPDDPRANDKLDIVGACDLGALKTDSKSVEASIKAFVEAATQLNTATKEADTALRDACLEIVKDPELGLTPPVSTATGAAACQPLLAYIQSIVKNQPQAKGLNAVPQWIELKFGERCVNAPGEKEACLSSCGDPCDVTKCEPGKISGTCPGQCLGTCTQTATSDAGVACQGNCIGEFPIPTNGTATPGGTCFGECDGTCGGAIYTGNCEGACASDFTGHCGGTCVGTCGDNNQNVGAHDAGAPLDGSLAPQDPNPPPYDDGTGQPNCPTGICKGTCSKQAYGTCYARCVDYKVDHDAGAYTATLAHFWGGRCTDSVCVGNCRSAVGSGAASATGNSASPLKPGTCVGECTQLTKPTVTGLLTNTDCTTGICRPIDGSDAGAPFCDTDLDPASRRCEGKLNCNQNPLCASACEAKAALTAKCNDPLAVQVYSVDAPAFYNVIMRHGLALGRAIIKLHQAQAAFSFIEGRNYGDFVTLDTNKELRGRSDLAELCVKKGQADLDEAGKILSADIAADPTVVRFLEQK